MKKFVTLLFVGFAILVSCNKKMAPTTVTSKDNPPPPMEEIKPETKTDPPVATPIMPISNESLIAHGEIVYNSKCGTCHELKKLSNYTVSRWEGILRSMMPKAKLDFSEQEMVKAYVNANARKFPG